MGSPAWLAYWKKRLEPSGGQMAFQEHKTSQDGDGNLAAPVDDADAGIDGACDPVRFSEASASSMAARSI